ncbi:MAG: hypothetical protein A3D44_01770 [Candidatus Staskawiczbacteria bacterium RIFCSPHIGHO2_02_FULL_42_22]|uniref:PilN domain-containing protein n=1 Tax=Candidatus Staskawiczbacteria bacterium RIFCSPHIGHO2_02_FULL_42_22 TaxID=1802207 RepID=A0A1G2I127_9BACT|nr:MAG: hypothetical protein A3D44_01770 [Candidatus Staskawiczbacteria bacterium RIFCSPHIGHO2_02_FULL_42_22]
MVDFQQIHQTKTTASFWIDFLFYFVCYLLAVAVICFAIFSLKAYFLHQNINDLDQKIAAAGTSTQKQEEKDLITYKKRVEDFTSLINGHTISLNIFNFIEQKTLPSVWFSAFDVSQAKNEFTLAGQAKDMKALSNQVKIFEESTAEVKNVSVLNSQVSGNGSVTFVINMVLEAMFFKNDAYSTN